MGSGEANMTSTTPRDIALSYIDACSRKDFDAVRPLLAADVRFVGPSRELVGADDYIAVLRRIAPIWVRSEVRKVFCDGGDVCVIYDLVTNTAAGAVPTVEWLTVVGEKIASVFLSFDRVTFKPASDELALRKAG